MDDLTGNGLRSCSLSDLAGGNVVEFALGRLPTKGLNVLWVGIRGTLDNHQHDRYGHAAGMVMAGVEAWAPAAVVLDLSELDYSWGDRMADVLTAPSRWVAGQGAAWATLRDIFGEGSPSSVAVVVSDRCREASRA